METAIGDIMTNVSTRTTSNTLALFLLGILLGVALTGNAHAQVTLENTIKKIETYVAEDGEVKRSAVDAESVVPGDELKYVIRFKNEGEQPVDAGSIVIRDLVPEHTEYIAGTAFGSGTNIFYSLDGENFADPEALKVVSDGTEVMADAGAYRAIQWSFAPELQPGESGYVSFNVRLK